MTTKIDLGSIIESQGVEFMVTSYEFNCNQDGKMILQFTCDSSKYEDPIIKLYTDYEKCDESTKNKILALIRLTKVT